MADQHYRDHTAKGLPPREQQKPARLPEGLIMQQSQHVGVQQKGFRREDRSAMRPARSH